MISLPSSQLSLLIVLWFLTGRQLGHVGAKYARSKQSSKIILGLLIVITLGYTFYLFS